jgi:predicted unusual protein kinase regulating ubiquinone biosynthesis (AarF/ABC1/UbiB family)
MKQMGFVARGANEQMFEQVIEYFHERFQENISLDSLNLKDIKFDPQKGLESVADLRKMDISLRELSENFHVPKEIIILERTLLLLMGLCTELDPTLNPMTVIRPYLERFVLGDEGDWSTFAVESAKDLVLSMAALPADIRKMVQSAREGELSVRFRRPARNDDLVRVRCWVREVASRRVTFGYAIEDSASGALLATATTAMMVLDTGMAPTRLPERIRDMLAPVADPVRL